MDSILRQVAFLEEHLLTVKYLLYYGKHIMYSANTLGQSLY